MDSGRTLHRIFSMRHRKTRAGGGVRVPVLDLLSDPQEVLDVLKGDLEVQPFHVGVVRFLMSISLRCFS